MSEEANLADNVLEHRSEPRSEADVCSICLGRLRGGSSNRSSSRGPAVGQ